jgi:hypothetical protein
MRLPIGTSAIWLLALALGPFAGSTLAAQTDSLDFCLEAGGPLTVFNDAPLRQVFIRALPQGGCPVRRPTYEMGLHVANQYVDLADGSRVAFLDSELYRLDMTAAYPLGHTREIRIEVPLQARSGGFLDGLIESWHDLLGLPQDTRLQRARNRSILEISDSTAGRPLIDETGEEAGLGDVTVRFLQRLSSPAAWGAVALRMAVKLPTGSSTEIFGSGAPDIAFGVAASWRVLRTVRLDTDFDVALLGDSPLSDELDQSGTLTQALVGFEWRAWPNLGLLAQLQSESAPLVVGLPDVDRRSLVLAWGVQHALSRHLQAEVALAEDLRVRTAPDLTLRTGLRWSPP